MSKVHNLFLKRSIPLPMVMILSFALLLSGCSAKTSSHPSSAAGTQAAGTQAADTQAAGTQAASVEKKDELILAVGSTADSGVFDPKKGWGTHAQIRLTHSSLLKIDSDLNFIPDLAKSYEVSADGLTWTFPLREDVKFSNGEPVTAEDVKFTYEMLQEDGISYDLSFVKSIEAKDGNMVVITLKQPHSVFVGQLTEIGIVPKDLYNDHYSHNPVGSGPYKVVQYNEGQQIILEYNDYWYGSKPQFKKLTLLLLPEDAALAAAKAGEADLVYVPPSFADQKVEGMKLLRFESIDSRGIAMPTLKSGGKGKINKNEVNVGNDVTSDPAIRKALSVGLSRDSIIDVALDGYAQKAFSICDSLPWFNDETVIQDGNVEEAKKILADAGWADTNHDGIVEKNGQKAEFDLLYSSSDQLRSDMSLAVADMAKEFGIQINAKGATWDEIFVKGKENAVMWAGGQHHPGELYSLYNSRVINQGNDNITQYTNPIVDGYLDQAMEAATQEEANKYWKLAQWDGTTGFSTLGDIPIIWLARVDHLYLSNEKLDVGKQPIHSHGYQWALFGNITDWTWAD